MISQKTYLIFLLTGIVAIAGSIGQASAQQPNYPSMQRFDSAVTPPAAPVRDQRQYPPQQQPQYRPQYPPQQQPQYRPQQQPQYRPQYRPQYQPQAGGYGGPGPYGRSPVPYGGPRPYGQGAPYAGPYGGRSGPWNNGGWNRGPWGGNNNGFGNWFGGNRGPYGNNGPFGDMFGGGRNGIWGMHPDEWFTSDPEDGFSYMWDDMINAPSEMGEMPGGWNAPSISVPNPVDIGSEFRDEAPNLMHEIPDMINVN